MLRTIPITLVLICCIANRADAGDSAEDGYRAALASLREKQEERRATRSPESQALLDRSNAICDAYGTGGYMYDKKVPRVRAAEMDRGTTNHHRIAGWVGCGLLLGVFVTVIAVLRNFGA